MNSSDCYRLLGLTPGVGLTEIKTTYRRLARQYHPDAYAGDSRLAWQAQEKFMQLTEAYKFLLEAHSSLNARQPVSPAGPQRQTSWQGTPTSARDAPQSDFNGSASPPGSSFRKTRVTRKEPVQTPGQAGEESQLKPKAYQQLQDLLKFKRFAQAVALTEGLGHRFPHDPEIRQWQAITYQQWGRQLIAEGRLEKARAFLKKAVRTDPHNRSLWKEVERDFRRLEQVF